MKFPSSLGRWLIIGRTDVNARIPIRPSLFIVPTLPTIRVDQIGLVYAALESSDTGRSPGRNDVGHCGTFDGIGVKA